MISATRFSQVDKVTSIKSKVFEFKSLENNPHGYPNSSGPVPRLIMFMGPTVRIRHALKNSKSSLQG